MRDCGKVGLFFFYTIELTLCTLFIVFFPDLGKKEELCPKLKEGVEKFSSYQSVLLSFGIISCFFSSPFFACICYCDKIDIKYCVSFINHILLLIFDIILWSVTLALFDKLDSLSYESDSNLCIKIKNDYSKGIEHCLIIISCHTLFIIIILIAFSFIVCSEFEICKCIKERLILLFVFITFIFELLFNILIINYLPNESDYKKEKLNNIYEIEKELNNAKNINQASLGFEVIIFIFLFFKLISCIYDKCKNNKLVLDKLIIIQFIFIFVEWSMSLRIIDEINKLRLNENYNNSINNLRKNIIRFIIIISFYLILIVFQFILVKFNEDDGYNDSDLLILFKPNSIFNILEIGINIVIFILFPYINYYKSKYFYQIYNENIPNNTYNITETDIFNLEKLYTVPKRLNKTVLSFCIINLVILLLKYILYLKNKCKREKSKIVHIFNCINLVLLFFNLYFSIIHIFEINKINIDASSDIIFLSEKIKSNLIYKNMVIITLFICYIILLIIPIIISAYIKKKDKKIQSSNDRLPEPVNTEIVTVSRFMPTIETETDIIPPKIQEIIKKLIEKIEDFLKIYIEEENKIKIKMSEFLKERKIKLEKFLKDLKDNPKSKDNFEDNKKKEIEKFIKKLNEDELEIELDKLKNKLNKIHYIFNLGKDVIDEIKNVIIDNLKDKMASLPSFAKSKIESQIDEINKYSPKKFLDSKFGEPLKNALEKYGLSKAFLNSYKEELLKERKQRREEERKELSLEKNEFENEDKNLNIDLYDLIKEEYSDEDFKVIIN